MKFELNPNLENELSKAIEAKMPELISDTQSRYDAAMVEFAKIHNGQPADEIVAAWQAEFGGAMTMDEQVVEAIAEAISQGEEPPGVTFRAAEGR
ncbi:hypothetical protein [Amycolatopsis dendrobii]|uniref:Uncharacterized protein n=1 Tax=Amycolatopsis dendrobii TaxID=2760662 RepID=A0A7W3VWF9_9PSEU|nr:hypothetical protein [Amycolatopsis dendrobii]MBB1153982.1 hypothetical protein [Amycolatopsis dendrobii]